MNSRNVKRFARILKLRRGVGPEQLGNCNAVFVN